MFSGLYSLQELSLSRNNINTIKKGSFRDNSALANLYLNKNKIHTIEPGSFWNNSALTKLDLENNALETLPECIFHQENHPNYLHDLMLGRNSLSCNQSLCWLRQVDNDWLRVVDHYYDTSALIVLSHNDRVVFALIVKRNTAYLYQG